MTILRAISIPELDLRRFDAGEVERRAFLAELRQAARDVGFFYLVGHEIEPGLLGAVMDSARRFFALPHSDKLALAMVNSPHFRGYTRIGGEVTRGLQDWREQIDIGAEQPACPVTRDAPAWMRLRGPNQWPAALPELPPTILLWQTAATRVLTRLMRAFALSLGQSEDAFDPLCRNDPHTLVKLIRYPGRDLTASDQGVGAHKDSELLTLLLQDEEGGLQVQTAQGWVDVVPRADALLVNIGELLELVSEGYFRATLHRVITPAPGRERISAAFFLGAPLDATVPLLSLPPELAAQAQGADRDPNNPLFREVGQNYLKGRLRSHPDVAQRHYVDFVAAKRPPGHPAPADS
jgi:isopenicillin N synthase-like dioxygenase